VSGVLGGGGGGGEEMKEGDGMKQGARSSGLRLRVNTQQQHHPHAAAKETHIPSPTGGPPGIARPRASSKASSPTARAGEGAEGQSPISPVSPSRARAAAPTVPRFGDAPPVVNTDDTAVGEEVGPATPASPSEVPPPGPPKKTEPGASQLSVDLIKGGKGISVGAST
jgi:lysosomal acid lipase/cholesteryl ester hydrolase